jgi:hypothetical protein
MFWKIHEIGDLKFFKNPSSKPHIGGSLKPNTEGSFQNQELHNKCWSEDQFNNI